MRNPNIRIFCIEQPFGRIQLFVFVITVMHEIGPLRMVVPPPLQTLLSVRPVGIPLLEQGDGASLRHRLVPDDDIAGTHADALKVRRVVEVEDRQIVRNREDRHGAPEPWHACVEHRCVPFGEGAEDFADRALRGPCEVLRVIEIRVEIRRAHV